MKRLAGRPFVLLGVNSDSDRAEIKRTVQQENISWRSWWDGGGPTGPIQTQWQVTQRPTIHLLDAEGIIRRKNIEAEDVDAAVDALLREIDGKSGK
ncbi:MAG: hypothetical protein N2C14_06955 [Planctomycetales bacterium]